MTSRPSALQAGLMVARFPNVTCLGSPRALSRSEKASKYRSLMPASTIRVKASIECKVLTSSDLPLQHVGGALYIAYRQAVEQLAAMVTGSDVRPLGLEHLP